MSIINNGLLLASGADAAVGYQISRSLRFNGSVDSTSLTRTPASAGNRKTWTWSGWVKRSSLSSTQRIFSSSNSSNTEGFYCEFISSDTLSLYDYSNPTIFWEKTTSQVFRDTGAWFHLLVAFDSTNATAADRVKLYVNGVLVTAFSTSTNPSLNYDSYWNAARLHAIGKTGDSNTSYFNGYLADIYFLDGTATTPSTFAETDAVTGQWVPKTPTGISYGTNGFRLTFSDNSGTTSTTLGKDAAGSNNWTPNNFSVASGSGNDSLVDTPTSYGTDDSLGGSVRGNYATFNPTESSTSGTKTLTNGNIDVLLADANAARLTIPPIQGSGKYQWEITIGSKTATYYQMGLNLLSMVYATGDLHATFRSDGNLSNTLSGSWSGTGVSYTSGDVITVTYDNATNACAFYKNGVYSATFTVSGTPQASLNFGVFYGGSGNTNYTLNAGQRPFAYPVSGFKALCDTNLPAPVVAKPNTVFDVIRYTGNGSTQTIPNVNTVPTTLGFSPDLVWIKDRTQAFNHALHDIVRGAGAQLVPNDTTGEVTTNQVLTAFTTSGFTVNWVSGFGRSTNESPDSYVAWAWDAGSSTVSNTQGSITSQVRANASAGFSIVTYTANAPNNTIGHGLNTAPAFVVVKNRSRADNWYVYHSALGVSNWFNLNTTSAATSSTNYWGTTGNWTSTTFGVNTNGTAGNNYGSDSMVAYCFAPVAGFSAFGSYTGNGSTDGPFVYTGFRPKWLMYKQTNASSEHWHMRDALRDPYNATSLSLRASSSAAESDEPFDKVDFLSNGFKLRGTGNNSNSSGSTYVYMCFAESPFQYARAR